jgi:glycosyltransferase involved in cell wall biosynthesis
MKKVLFITAHRPDRSPSQRFRFEQYFNFLEANGYKCEMSYLITEKDDKIFYSPGKYLGKAWILLKSILKRFRDVARANSCSIIFIQREAFMLGTTFFEKLISKSKAKIIFDFDDAVWLDQQSEFSSNKNLIWLKKPSKTSEIIKLSSLVFAGNQYLMDYALQYNPNVVLIPTTIDTEEYSINPLPKGNAPICIGWSGSQTTIEHFAFAIPVLKRIKEKYKDAITFKVIGDKNYTNEALEIQGLPWKKESELKELQTFDIGIMPLPNQEWTKGKCGLKGLQYMSLGIPTIMSPVGVNTVIIQDGVNGFLADTQEEWFEKLECLIQDADLRKKLGEAGKRTVEEKYSVHVQKERYLYYFDQLAKH